MILIRPSEPSIPRAKCCVGRGKENQACSQNLRATIASLVLSLPLLASLLVGGTHGFLTPIDDWHSFAQTPVFHAGHRGEIDIQVAECYRGIPSSACTAASIQRLLDPRNSPSQVSEWTKMGPAVPPFPRLYVRMAYDNESDRIVLFGGEVWGAVWGTGYPSDSDETWAYDFNTNTWTNMSPSSGPSGRGSHMMAYDSESDRVIAFGGRLLDGKPLADTWAYDFNSNTWTDMNPTAGPAARFDAAIAYDIESDRVILFGGNLPGRSDETWAYDFNSNTWTDMNPTARPTARFQAAMAYDIESDRAILFGGNLYDSTPPFANDTWAYDLNTNSWVARVPSVNPGPRGNHAFAYDYESDRLVLHGGANGYAVLGDTWLYDFNSDTWKDAAPSTSGPARWQHAIAYDTESDRVVLFGGEVQRPAFPNNETWAYVYGFSAPSAPLNLGATPGDSRAILSWQPSASDGGLPVTSYRIYRATTLGAETFLVDAGSVLTHVDAGLTNGITYYYEVAAVNAIGEGPRSNEASTTPVTLPSAPRNLVATPGNAEVTLTWTPPTSDGGSSITDYIVYRGDSEGSLTMLTAVGIALTYTDSALTNGVTYHYAVGAVNAPGEGPRSNVVAVTLTAPGPGGGLDPLALTAIVGVTTAVASGAGFMLWRRKRRPRE